MSLGINGNNGINVNANTNSTKGIATQSAGNNNSVNFNYDELHKLFLEKGLSAVMEKLCELKEAGLVTEFSVGSNDYGNTVIKFSVGDNKYQFTGAKGDSVDTEPETTTPEAPKTDGGVPSTQSVGDTPSVEAPTDSRALTQAEFEARKKGSHYYDYNGQKRSDVSWGNGLWVTDYKSEFGEFGYDANAIEDAGLPMIGLDHSLYEFIQNDDYRMDDIIDAKIDYSYEWDIATKVCDKLGIKYTDRHDASNILLGETGLAGSKVTAEQIEYVNQHPEEFYGVYFTVWTEEEANNPNLGVNAGDIKGCKFNDLAYTELKRYVDTGVSADEAYWSIVYNFGQALSNSESQNGGHSSYIAYAPQCNGDVVEFTDETIKKIKELMENDHEHLLGYQSNLNAMQMFGLNKDDDEATIKQKIQDFCYSLGSTDGKTVLLEDYYKACGENNAALWNGNQNNSCPTYEYIVTTTNNGLNLLISQCEELGIDISDLGLTKPGYTNITQTEEPTVSATGGIDYTPTGKISDIGVYLNKLEEKYPDIYEKYAETIRLMTQYCARGSSYSDFAHTDININLQASNNGFKDVIMYATGITGSDIRDTIYNQTAVNDRLAEFFGAEVDGPFRASEVTIDFAKFMNFLLGDNETGTNYFYASGAVEAPTVNSGKNNSTNGVTNDNSYTSMDVGGITVDSTDEATKALKQNYVNQLGNDIKQYTSGKFISLLDVDKNGNVIISDNAKSALKEYLQGLIKLEKEDIELYDKNVELTYKQTGVKYGSAFKEYCDDTYLALFNLSSIPYEAEPHTNMYKWIDNMQDIVDDDNKLNQLINTFAENLGLNGNNMSLENFYNKILEKGLDKLDCLSNVKSDYVIQQEAKTNSFLSGLQEKYPEVFNEYETYIKGTLKDTNQYDNPYEFVGTIRMDWYIDSNDNKFFGGNQKYIWYKDVLDVAAGISVNDSFAEKKTKRENLVNKMRANATGNTTDEYGNPTLDVVDMFNYLLGNNSQKINYFDKIKQDDYNLNNNVQAEEATKLDDIDVKQVNTVLDYDIVGVTNHYSNENIANIANYIENLLNPIYEKYYAFDGAYYTNFTYNDEVRNPDSKEYVFVTWGWKDDATKNAMVKEIEEVMQKALAQYPNIITSISYDGQRVSFRSIYDEKDDATTTPNYVWGSTIISRGSKQKGADPTYFEPAIDTPISYTNSPTVIKNNPPEGVGNDGTEIPIYKTAWDGIYCNGGELYLWDEVEQEYVATSAYTVGYNDSSIKSLAEGDISKLLNKNIQTDSGTNPYNYTDLLLVSLVYGYNRTSDPNILEKDGKFYQLSYLLRWRNPHPSVAEIKDKFLEEIDYKNGSVATSQAKPATSISLGDKKAVNTDTTDKTEEIIYKSEDLASEMKTAAEKLNLTAAKTTGTYYQFSAQGSYLYVWNPQTKKFKAFSVNARNADGTINQEFTQAGKAVNRTETNVYYEALLEAYKNGYNFTANYPWVCEKDGVYYEYDKEAGYFKKRTA